MNKKFTMLFIMVLSLAIFLMGCEKKESTKPVEEKPITVETHTVKKGNLAIETSLSGVIKPIEEASVAPKISGKTTKINVEMGDYVKEGTILFELDQEDMYNAIKQAEAAYATSLANFKKIEEQIQNAKENYERMKALYDEGAISKQQLEQVELQASETSLEVARFQSEQSRVAIENAKSQLDHCIVRAPISGVITKVNIHKGEMASPAADAIHIANIDRVSIETSIAENLINKVHVGDKVDVTFPSLEKKSFKGKITALPPAPAKNSLTYSMKIILDNKDRAIKPGMFAEISVVSDKRENIITIPSETVLLKNEKHIVFLVSNNQAKIKEVSLGLDNGKKVEIKKGLKEGDILVVKGQNYLDDGNKVQVIK